jgi:hypothetical protein
MSDGNVVDFGKALNSSKSNNAKTIEERIMNCYNTENCECMYCNYKKNAANMILEMLVQDITNFENNNKAKICTYDLKEIFFQAIKEVKRIEKEPDVENEE